MRLELSNPFKKETNELDKQLNAQKQAQNLELTNDITPQEQLLMNHATPDPDLTKWQQTLDPWLVKMVHRLKREVETTENNWQPMEDMDPLCSDECIYNLVAILEPNTAPNVMKAKFTDEQIAQEIWLLEKRVILKILVPEMKKNGTNTDNLSQVKKIFRSFAMPTYFRAIGGFESLNERAIRSYKELHSSGINEQPKKKGFFDI